MLKENGKEIKNHIYDNRQKLKDLTNNKKNYPNENVMENYEYFKPKQFENIKNKVDSNKINILKSSDTEPNLRLNKENILIHSKKYEIKQLHRLTDISNDLENAIIKAKKNTNKNKIDTNCSAKNKNKKDFIKNNYNNSSKYYYKSKEIEQQTESIDIRSE